MGSEYENSLEELGSYIETYHVDFVSAASNFMIARAPWASPVNKKFQLVSLAATTRAGSGLQSEIILWDQDLSNTTPPTAGSAGGALIRFGAAANAASGAGAVTTVLAHDVCPPREFIGAITGQSSIINVHLAVTVKVI